MSKYKYFTIEELCYSTTAKINNIDNQPNETIINNLTELIEVLDIIREEWTKYCEINDLGKGSIIVNSGYRCHKLNKLVGGVSNSSHLNGYAVDLEPSNNKNLEFWNWLKDYLIDNNINFDSLINEKPKNNIPSWVHFALYNNNKEQRKRILTLK